MPLLPRRFERLKAVLNCRMADLTVLLEHVDKPHNLSAILRSCDAVGVLEAHAINRNEQSPTFNNTAKGSQKWVNLRDHSNIENAIARLRKDGFKIYGTNLNFNSYDYRDCDFRSPTAFVLGTEKFGLSQEATSLIDRNIYIPMEGMVESLNVSVAAAILLFEALRQRHVAGIVPKNGEGLSKKLYQKCLFEWAYPEVAEWCKDVDREYPDLSESGEILETLPRTLRVRY